MDPQLIEAIVDISQSVPPESLCIIIDTLRKNTDIRRCIHSIRPYLDSRRTIYNKFNSEWNSHPEITPVEVATVFSVVHTLQPPEPHLQLAWTGPKTTRLVPRRMDAALCDVINHAHSRIFLISYVYFSEAETKAAIANACSRGVQLHIVLEADQAHGGTMRDDQVARMRNDFAEIPFSQNMHYYRWQHEGLGCIHAKCAVADDSCAYISSANLTHAAMNHNMELGVLIMGGAEPATLSAHFTELISTGTLSPC